MITTEFRDHVTVVRLEHGKVNAFDIELMRGWIAELARLEQADTSAVVLTGTGAVFSAGVELRRLTEGGRDYVKAFLPLLGDAFFKTFTFSKPLIAAVNGHAIAGGCVLACACDYRVMAEGKGRMGTPELSVGVPFPSMAMEILRLVVPAHRLQSIIYRGLTCTPDDALANGFVDELAAPDALLDRAVEVAAHLGSLPPASFALTKRIIRQPSRDRVVRYMRSVDEEVLEAWMSSRVQNAVRAYVERTLRK
jgi:enoyl-CoA hydratase